MAGLSRTLCRLDEIADGAARGFGPAPGGFTGLFAVRRGAEVFVYVNACPHIGTSLDWAPDQFLTADGAFIVCATHGALFGIAGGVCVHGPCLGDRLEAIPAQIVEGVILVPADAGL